MSSTSLSEVVVELVETGGGNETTRYLYINNQPDGKIPFLERIIRRIIRYPVFQWIIFLIRYPISGNANG